MKNIREIINEYEHKLKNLSGERKDKVELVQLYTKLKDMETQIKEFANKEEKENLLKEVDSLLFIVSSMLDYYDEEKVEK